MLEHGHDLRSFLLFSCVSGGDRRRTWLPRSLESLTGDAHIQVFGRAGRAPAAQLDRTPRPASNYAMLLSWLTGLRGGEVLALPWRPRLWAANARAGKPAL